MTLGVWASLIDEDAHDNAKANVHKAIDMGHEKYAEIIGQLSEDLAYTRQMDALLSALIVGNLAFDAQPGAVIALGDTGFSLTLVVEADE